MTTCCRLTAQHCSRRTETSLDVFLDLGIFGKNPPESVWCCAVDNTSLIRLRPLTNLQQIHSLTLQSASQPKLRGSGKVPVTGHTRRPSSETFKQLKPPDIVSLVFLNGNL